MYTDIPWQQCFRAEGLDGNSFVFSFYGDRIKIYRHIGDDQGEITHNKGFVFAMEGGPCAVECAEEKEAWAHLGENFIAEKGTNRDTVLCGQQYPKIKEVEIYML